MNHNQELANRLVALAAGLLDGSVMMIKANSEVNYHTRVRTTVCGKKELMPGGRRTVALDIQYEEGIA